MKDQEVIKKPLITEKAFAAPEGIVRYAFVVDLKAGKGAIKAAVERLFKVNVEKVNTSIVRGKMRRVGARIGQRSNWKKAHVTLKAGEKIDIFEGA